MATEVNLPALGESVTEGTVTRWLKQVGDTVAVDEPLLEVSTDKVDTEIPSPVAGTLLEIKANEDDTVEVGAVLARDRRRGRGVRRLRRRASPTDAGGRGGARAEEPEPGGRARAAEEPSAGRGARAGSRGAGRGEPRRARPTTAGAGGGGGGTPVTLPALGESVTEGTVTRWLKQVGDDVAVDEPLLEVSTDKVDTEIPSPVAGTLLEIKVERGRDRRGRRRAGRHRLRRRRRRRRRARGGARGRSRGGAGARAGARARARAGARARAEPEPEPKAEEKAPEPKQEQPRSSEAPQARAPAAATAASPAATSPRWCARWPPSTASTCRP